MAAINEQQEFALHSLNDENKNKTFVFVKLTDSALKSIEDYMSLSHRPGVAKPTIQFQNNSNQGAITLPLANGGSSNGGKNEIRYSFNLSNVDADGPQGSFEFLRQRKLNRYEECIESLGSMFIKMQFHASDDIYAKTKVKMANAELDAKKHSTKVIKETGLNVGRKIKKTIVNGANTQSLTSSSSSSGNTEQSSAYHSSYVKDLLNVNSSTFDAGHSPKSNSSKYLSNHNNNATKSTITNNTISANNNVGKLAATDELNSINHLTSTKDGCSQQQNSSTFNSSTFNQSKLSSTSNATANSFTQSNNNAATNAQSQQPNPEILRKPIRDRVIHLLALRPYKKPELHAKLNRGGLREKDKKGLSALLMQIANLKDNAYHLSRGAWHEVQVDDWPFYSNEERDQVRKRNPLLSTNTSSNANDLNSAISSISPLANFDNQQSPSMYHSSSPSNKRTIDQSSLPSTQVMTSDYATANKKQRISHHKANGDLTKKRSPPLSNSVNNSIIPQNSTLLNSTAVHSVTNGVSHANSQVNGATSKLTTKYDDVINIWENKPKTPDEQASINGYSHNSHSSPELNSSVNSNSSNGLVCSTNKLITNGLTSSSDNNSSRTNSKHKGGLNYRSNGANLSTAANNNSNGASTSDRYHTNNISYTSHSNQFHHSSNNATTNSHFNSFTNHHYPNSNQHNSSLCSTPNSSPDSGTGSNDGSLASTSSSRSSNLTNEDYLNKYTEISSIEQFRKYKQDFNCEYEEYKKLHSIVDRNANKFALLEQELRQAKEGTETWNRIMERILREYNEIKRDSTYLNARSRMQYLHMKLSHIKSLILNYTNQNQYRKHGSSSSIKLNSLNSSQSSHKRSVLARNHTAPCQYNSQTDQK